MTSKKNTYCNKLLTLLLLILGTVGAWAQTDYSGVWFIANDNSSNGHPGKVYSKANDAEKWYLVPAADPQQSPNYIDAYYSPNHATTNGDPNKPFLATYQTNKDLNSIWIIKKSDEAGYYFIIHALTGKYVIYEVPLPNDPNTNTNGKESNNGKRKTMHLQTIDNGTYNPATNDNFKFGINSSDDLITGNINIYPKSRSDWYWNPAGQNNTDYHGQSSGETTDLYRNGLVGVYNNVGTNSIWHFENASSATALTPIISDLNEETNTFTITSPTVAFSTIRYTTDGNTTPDASTGNTVTSGSDINITGSWNVQAVGVFGPFVTPIAGPKNLELVRCATPVIAFDNTALKVSITCATTGSTIYYTTDGGIPTASSTEYSAPFSVTSPTTVKAIATHATLPSSVVGELVISKVATPTIQNNGSNAISITTATPGATIYYTTDGSTPTTSSTVYTIPLTENVSNVTIKAIAVKENMITSAVGSGLVKLQCATPVITRVGQKFTLSCSMPTDAALYYTINGGSETLYNGPVSFTKNQLPMTVTAVAKHSNYTNSETASTEIKNGAGTPDDPYLIAEDTDLSNFITNVNNGTVANKCFKLITDISASGTAAITYSFSGIFDGNGYTISGLSHPLFKTVDGGVVKNITLKNVAISSSDSYVGAIAGTAQGYSRIYNCGILPNDATFPEGIHPYVTTSGACAGGIVGRLADDSRVINCYSYADVSASTRAGGIVGQNTYASTALITDGKYADLRTAVVNCLFYGDIKGGTYQYGVYGGSLITNAATTGISSYNYYRNGSTFSTSSGKPTAYNCSFPAEERYLTQVEFHRSLLNSNRELCGWWVGSDVAPNTLTTAQVQAIPKKASLMYKWVVDPNVAPYPILKPFGKYASVINGNTGTPWVNRATANPYEGKQLGTLTVTVHSGTHSSAASQILYIPITDMDTLRYDFGYRKIQLPYYNTVFGNPEADTWAEKYANNYTDQVVTGWKITAVTGGTKGSFVADWQDGYNFADRKCTDKDLYDVSGRVFAQGGNYYVPDGVTAITIEAYWGKAIYVRNDEDSYDRVNITLANTGSHFAPAGTRGDNINGATVNTSIRGALTNIDAKKTVYDYALVLVGNVQESVGKNDVKYGASDYRGFTIMSVDLDFDEEPDYCLEWQLGAEMQRQIIAPIRFDFLPIVELGIAGKLHNSTNFYSLGCYRSQGHFEVTETSFIRFGQFEFELGTRDEGPIILNGGIYDQYCRGRNGETTQNINYVILGGHVVMPSFTPGAHVNEAALYQTRHCAVNALGGDFASFYLTGGYNEGIAPYEDNPHCYIDGGRFGTIAAAYKEGIWGDVTWRINHALIREFYGGGVMSQATGNNYKIVKGNIDVVIENSIVGKYCGGPKFGDMIEGKTVTTSAIGTTFNQFFGAGNGGTNYVQYKSTDATGSPISDWSNTINSNYHPEKYRNTAQGYEADYDIEIINTSTGDQAGRVVNRSYYYSAQFATTNTGDVSSSLTNCTINTNFYGGGFLGGVTGNVTSTLNNCTVSGSVFGAGYSASAGTVSISNKDKVAPVVNTYTGMIKPQSGGTSTTYYWTNEKTFGSTKLSTSSPAIINPNNDGKNYFYTEIPLDNLGTVSGNVTLTINGNTVVDENGKVMAVGKNVYGGGEESGVGGNTTVSVTGGTIGTGTTGFGNVFGAGKGLETDYTAALVKGNSNVTMSGGTVKGNIYGGGELSSVGTFTFSTTDTSEPAKIDSWTDNTGKTTINISGGKVGNEDEYTYDANNTISHTNGGNVFAGSKGSLFQVGTTTATSALWSKFAKVKNTEITISANAAILSNVYGGGEIGSVGYDTNTGAVGGTVITINGGTIGTEIKDGETAKYTFGSVFGGGYGSSIEELIYSPQTGDPIKTNPKLHAGIVYGSTKVTMSGDNTRVWASVYGGGEVASVKGNPSTAEADVFTTDITINGGFIGRDKEDKDKFVSKAQFGGATMGNVYGGGSGYKDVVRAGQIKGNTKITINGGTIYHNVYGGGAYATVGDFNYGYTTAETGPFAGIPKVSSVNGLATEKTGFAKITITGGTIGVDGMENGMVFGSSRGDVGEQRDLWLAWVYNTKVEIGSTTAESDDYPLIKGSVYGSGENGHVYSNTDVIIHSGTIGVHRDNDDYNKTRGNVYGGGCGEDTYPSNTQVEGMAGKYEPTAGIVYGTAKVTVDGGIVKHNIYGAGALGSVGQIDANGAITSGGTTTIAISGGTIGHDGNDNGNVYGAARGNANSIQTGIAQVQTTGVTISGSADVKGSVFGGGEAGTVLGAVTVNMNGGDVLNDVYGGGALADTNTANWDATNNTWADTNDKSSVYTTAVNLTGGTVTGNVYGGGLGKMAVGEQGQTGYEPAIEAKVYGNTTVELNNGVADDAKGCIVKGSIFGCNNMSGSPQGTTTVHIYKTQREGADRITNAAAEGEEGQPGYIPAVENAKEKGIKFGGEYVPASFDVKAVYGGGNMAAYQPVDLTTGTTDVIIDGCDRTSICQVYGGGNAACTPATKVTINGTYEIGELFGGGNGKDDIFVDNIYKPNPGANVGYKDYSEFYFEGAVWKVRDKTDADTKEKRIAKYQYGNGVASVNVFGGLVHRVFGGSNTKGNVRKTALTLLEEKTSEGKVCCDFKVDEAYGGGKSAPMDAEAKLLMACIPGLQAVYGGAEAAAIQGNVTLNITNGTFDRVFGGNNLSGTINGSITVNVEEVGCKPVKIGELYGGGNEAGYSIYGYKEVTENGKKVWKPRESDHDSGTGPANPYNDPQVNVKSFTSIGNIYGGGYGGGATMVGNPTVNVNVANGRWYDNNSGNTSSVVGENEKIHDIYPIPSHAKGKMGAINNVFGGGNAAKVIGNTNVNIATLEEVYVVKEIAEGASVAGLYTRSGAGTTASPFEYTDATGTAQADTTYYEKKDVLGVDIRGNVYGGGNNAEVTGDSKVKIGKREGE